jgi:hypothetical protein
MAHVNLVSPVGRVMARVTAWLRNGGRRAEAPASLRVTAPDEPRPSAAVPAAYMPLFTYLDRRYASTVVLTFEQIEALLGFPPPSPAFADAEWWTGPPRGKRSPHRSVDRRETHRRSATERANRGV